MDAGSKYFNSRMENTLAVAVPTSGLKLPKIQPLNEGGQVLNPRPTFRAYGKTHQLKLPELGFQSTSHEIVKKPETPTSSRSSIFPLKSTKQKLLNRESSARDSKISDRLSLEIDKKISSVNRSLSAFQKKYKTVNNNMLDAVRKSAADSIRNRTPTPASVFSGSADSEKYFDKYFQELGLEKEYKAKEAKEPKEIFEEPPQRSCPRIFGLDPLTVIESCESSSGDSDSDSYINKTKLTLPFQVNQSGRPRNKYQSHTAVTLLNPTMTDGSDKEFLTKLKKREGQANKSIQEMQSQLSAVHQKVEIDRRKANLEASKGKPLYKPRRTELNEFVQTSGGMTGSWRPEDHSRFLKAFKETKYQPDKLIEAIMQQVKNKTAREVMAHVKWYEQFDSLNQANKDQLRNWNVKKRPERKVIYQMASEGHKTKLENEKRRQDHMKSKRVEERQRSQAMLSTWKSSKPKEEPSGKLGILEDVEKEMLEIVQKIQSLDGPGVKKLKPPRKCIKSVYIGKDAGDGLSNIISESEDVQYNGHLRKCRERESLSASDNSTKAVSSDDKDTRKSNSANSTTKKSLNILSKSSKQFPNISKVCGNKKNINGSRDDLTTENALAPTKSILELVSEARESQLTKDTHSHSVRRDAQRRLRMELQSQRSRVPNRTEDSNLWGSSNALLSHGSKKAVPSWRK